MIDVQDGEAWRIVVTKCVTLWYSPFNAGKICVLNNTVQCDTHQVWKQACLEAGWPMRLTQEEDRSAAVLEYFQGVQTETWKSVVRVCCAFGRAYGALCLQAICGESVKELAVLYDGYEADNGAWSELTGVVEFVCEDSLWAGMIPPPLDPNWTEGDSILRTPHKDNMERRWNVLGFNGRDLESFLEMRRRLLELIQRPNCGEGSATTRVVEAANRLLESPFVQKRTIGNLVSMSNPVLHLLTHVYAAAACSNTQRRRLSKGACTDSIMLVAAHLQAGNAGPKWDLAESTLSLRLGSERVRSPEGTPDRDLITMRKPMTGLIATLTDLASNPRFDVSDAMSDSISDAMSDTGSSSDGVMLYQVPSATEDKETRESIAQNPTKIIELGHIRRITAGAKLFDYVFVRDTLEEPLADEIKDYFRGEPPGVNIEYLQSVRNWFETDVAKQLYHQLVNIAQDEWWKPSDDVMDMLKIARGYPTKNTMNYFKSIVTTTGKAKMAAFELFITTKENNDGSSELCIAQHGSGISLCSLNEMLSPSVESEYQNR